MLKALVRKQFMEIFKGYLVNPKTQKARKKGQIIAMGTGFAVLMVFLCGIFFGLGVLMSDLLLPESELVWLYFAIMGLLSILLGVFGSVFNTYSGLYLAKDNDMLISMPIPVSKILASRLVSVYGLSLLYSGCVWLPACICSWVFGAPTALMVLFQVILMPVIALFVSVLTCALGWVVAIIAGRLKNKSFLTVVIVLAAFILYYYFCFNLSDLVESIVANAGRVSDIIREWIYPVYQLAMGAAGDVPGMLIFCGMTLVLGAVCIFVMTKTFTLLALGGRIGKKAVYREKAAHAAGVRTSLIWREWKRFTASANYMLNCGIGLAFMPILAIIAVVKLMPNPALLKTAMLGISMSVPTLMPLISMAVPCIMMMIAGMNIIAVPSISLEGKNLWILKTLPVRPRSVLFAKLNLHVGLNLVSALPSTLVLCLCMQADVSTTLASLLLVFMFVWLTGAFDLMLGLKRVNLHWTSEQMVIKQSLTTFLGMLFNWLVVIVVPGIYFLLIAVADVKISAVIYMLIWSVVYGIISALITRWLSRGGEKVFVKL